MVKVSGFTIIRNGVEYEYPFLESLRSLLPLCDEVVVNVGLGTDSTLQKIKELPDQHKIKIIQSQWPLDDPEKKKSGVILSEQTNIALQACQHDWAIYLQADEVLHEDDYESIRRSFVQAEALGTSVDALVFQYRHFYGSYRVVQETRSAYRREIRAIRRSSGAQSVGDAQSFLKLNAEGQRVEKLNALLCPARVFHYGWVKSPQKMKEKTQFMDSLYHGSDPTRSINDHYRYKKFWGLKQYQGTHPRVMHQKIQEKDWIWDLKNSPWVFSIKDVSKVILDLFEKITGYRPFEFKNYRLRS